ncbi:OmpA family protein [Sphingomonas morindae]|uniref:OmpA family protein n=1 Tax=Sphingomonas morindae TaxID=1541170 RepID=A0ABY4X9Y3_9SPHN|nr:OmpA family protein [Sphingomonas morindae]USI73734.1 OmpA family protein [Sphingomonas morindae]
MIARAAPAATPRWALSFADLCLVLLGFLLLLQAQRGDPAASLRAAFGAPAPLADERAAAPLFQPGEALLLPPARAMLRAAGARAVTRGARMIVESRGRDGDARRFDGWELAAARAAAVARALSEGGLAADRIDLRVEGTARAAARHGGQTIRLVTLV